MSPLSRLPRVHARVANIPRYSPPRTYPNITNSTSSHPPPSTTPTSIITHPLTPTPSVPSAYTPDDPTAPPHHMSLGTKLGLGMIPVVVGVCFMWIFFLLWWRRRQARKAILMGKLMPLTPEKDRTSFIPPVEDSKRGSRVLNLSAYSNQVSGGRYVGPRPPRRQEQKQKQKQWRGSNRASNRMSQLSARSAKHRSGADSPIDSSSPFKLKRGSTVRKSLGSEISDLWPSPPPPTAWVKRRDILESLPSSRFGQDMSGQKPQRMSGQERRSTAGSSKRPSRPGTSVVV